MTPDRERTPVAEAFIGRTVHGIGPAALVGTSPLQNGSKLGAGALLAAVSGFVVAVLASLAGEPRLEPIPPPPAEPIALPVLEAPTRPPVAARLSRGIPPSVEATADVRAAPWAPGIRLVRVARDEDWSAHRAIVEDATTEDRRAYAIGDLLPHGSLLVGVGERSIDVLVADRELVRLTVAGQIRTLSDFRTPREARPLARVPDLAPDYVSAAEQTMAATLDPDPAVVQVAIDELIAAGEPVLELVVPYVDSLEPVAAAEYAFPSLVGGRAVPEVQGDIAIAVLEAVTGQRFGDVFAPDVTPEERRQIARRWKRWWGVD